MRIRHLRLPRLFRLLPLVLVILAACAPDSHVPLAPPVPPPELAAEVGASPATASSSVTAAASWSMIDERLELRARFVKGQPNQLVPEYVTEGTRFRLRVRQAFNATSGLLEFRLAIINRTGGVLWTPLQLAASITRGVASLTGADISASTTAGTWDYGQFVGTDGSLLPDEVSEDRIVGVLVPGTGSASTRLSGLSVTVLLRGATAPAAVPNLDRVPSTTDLAQGFMNGTFVVQYRAGVLTPTELARLNATYGLVGQVHVPEGPAYIVFTTDGDSASTRATEARLRQDPAVSLVYAAPTRSPATNGSRATRLNPAFAGRGVIFGSSTRAFVIPGALERRAEDVDVNLVSAWEASELRGILPGSGVTIGYIDTGTDSSDPDFAQRLVLAATDCFVLTPGNCPTTDYDPSFHGTNVGALLGAASDGTGVVGAAYGAQLVSIRTSYSPWSRWRALAFVAARPYIRVLNLSYGGPLVDSLEAAHIRNLTTLGVLVVAAAGNDDDQHRSPSGQFHCFVGQPSYPAGLPEVVAVGGYDGSGAAPSNRFDCKGNYINVIAPDEALRNWDVGTSFSAPRVSGAAAVLLALNPSLSGAALRNELLAKHTVPVLNPSAWGSTFVARLLMGFGGVVGTVSSPQLGALAGVGVAASVPGVPPGTHSAITQGPTGSFRLGGLAAGNVSLVLSNLPAGCTDPSTAVAVSAAASTSVTITVNCVTSGPASGAWVGTYNFGPLRLDLTQQGGAISGNVTGANGCVGFHSGTVSGNTVILDYQYTVTPGNAGSACYPTGQRLTGTISANGQSMSGTGQTSYGGGPIGWTFAVTKQ